jgi:hypothetical protein
MNEVQLTVADVTWFYLTNQVADRPGAGAAAGGPGQGIRASLIPTQAGQHTRSLIDFLYKGSIADEI